MARLIFFRATMCHIHSGMPRNGGLLPTLVKKSLLSVDHYCSKRVAVPALLRWLEAR